MTEYAFDLPDPDTLSLDECAEWMARVVYMFGPEDPRGDFARGVARRIRQFVPTDNPEGNSMTENEKTGMLDHLLREVLAPLIPDWASNDVEKYAEATGLLATLKGGVVVGGLRLAMTVTPYDPDEDDEDDDPDEDDDFTQQIEQPKGNK